MKIIRFVVIVAVLLSTVFGGLYLKFGSTLDKEIDAYIVQVGIYKEEANADEMVNQLTKLTLANYKYSKGDEFVVITGVFLSEQEAKEMGQTISEKGISCVIKPTKFALTMQTALQKQDYKAIVKELSS